MQYGPLVYEYSISLFRMFLLLLSLLRVLSLCVALAFSFAVFGQ